MWFRIAVFCLLILSKNVFSQQGATIHKYGHYKISLETLTTKLFERQQLLISVHSNDLPLTRLLLAYEGSLTKFFVQDIINDKEFEIILMFENTLENIRIFSWKKSELMELNIMNFQNFLPSEARLLTIEAKKGSVERTVKILKQGKEFVLKQRFSFEKLQWFNEKK